MTKTPKSPIDQLDHSGFPLQLAVKHLINRNSGRKGWRVRYEEHAWSNPDAAASGFIDLVAENDSGSHTVVIECKRLFDGSMVFPNDTMQAKHRRTAKIWLSEHHRTDGWKKFGWYQTPMDPPSLIANYCAPLRGDSKADSLEKIAATLLDATEALAHEDKLIREASNRWKAYISLIVTNAALKVCSFNPAEVSLDTGTIGDHGTIETPYIRFHKQLSTRFPTEISFSNEDNRILARLKEHTVFVVQASHLEDFLEALEVE